METVPTIASDIMIKNNFTRPLLTPERLIYIFWPLLLFVKNRPDKGYNIATITI